MMPFLHKSSSQISVRRIAPTVASSSTAQQVSNLLRLAATVESKEELIRMSLPLLRLHIGEAMMLYDLLIKVRWDKRGRMLEKRQRSAKLTLSCLTLK